MSLNESESKRTGDEGKNEDEFPMKNSQADNKPENKLLLGTMQFYEDILEHLHDSFITVYNESGKLIEIWSGQPFSSSLGVNLKSYKGKLPEDMFDPSVASTLKALISEILASRKQKSARIKSKFPKGEFWFQVTFTPLVSEESGILTILGYFRDVTEFVNNELKLRKYKDHFTNFFESIPEGILLTNHKGIVTSVNKTFTSHSGYNAHDLEGFNLAHLPFLNSATSNYFKEIIDALQQNLPPSDFELEWKTASGLTRFSEIRSKLVTVSGRITGLQITFSDITDRKLIEKELIKSKQAYKIIIENSVEAIFIIRDGKVVFSNSRLPDLLGFSMNELMQKPFIGFVHPADRLKVESDFDPYKNKGTVSGIFRLLNKKSVQLWLEAKSVVIDWNGENALLVYAHDITDQKEKYEAESSGIEQQRILSEIIAGFGTIKEDDDVYGFIGKNIKQAGDITAVMMVSSDPVTGQNRLEHVIAEAETRESILSILELDEGSLAGGMNTDFIRDLSFGKLIKYNDGLFEKGSQFFSRNKLKSIQKTLNVGEVYMIGLKYDRLIYGNVVIFLPEGTRLKYRETLEFSAKLGSAALHHKRMFEEIKLREQKYRRIFEAFPDIYFRIDSDGTLTEISPSVYHITGYDPREVLGKQLKNIYPEKSNLFSLTRMILKHGAITDKDITLSHKRSHPIHASLNARLLVDESGHLLGSEGFIRDISERKRMEEKFQESEEKFRTLADFTYDWEYWSAEDGKIIYMSPSCESISGYTREQFYENPDLIREIVHPEDQPLFKAHLYETEHSDKQNAIQFNFRILTPDNKVKWINHICREVFSESGKSLGRRVSNRDITIQKKAEDDLRNSEERFKTLFYESPDAIFVEDYDGFVLDANPAACKLQQYTREELIGKSIFDLVPLNERETVITEFPRWLTGERTNYRGHFLTSKNEQVPIEIHGRKIVFSGKQALMFIVRDITEIVQKEENLKRSVERAEEADKLKSVFLANVSHEIRTPMNAIIGFSEILSNPDLSQEEREEFINYITQGGNTLLNLIEDIIDITKIEAGQIKINFADCNVERLLEELYATFLKMKNKNGRANVELRMNKPAVEEGFVISTDPNRIRQILSNLLGNAIKFTKEGFIEFGYHLKEEQITFYVKDTGIGIPMEKQRLIFERFGQVNDSRSSEFKGTGLGLSISKRLAELLGGELTVESEENKGSTFFLTLPISVDDRASQTPETKLTSKSYQWQDKLFLIAEDSILNYTFLEALFQRTNVKLLWAKNGREAVDLCRKNETIDLVLMDIKMPILSGLEAIAEIKKFRPQLPIVVQTAYAMPEDRERSLAAGGDEHLTKPLNVDELFDTISKFMN